MNAHFREAWRAVATAKIAEFGWQCENLAELAAEGAVDRRGAVDTLQDIAEANCLCSTFGVDYVASLIADAFTPDLVLEAAE